jgi:hypothetical protein
MTRPLEGDELARGLAVRISGDDVCRILDAVKDMPPGDALCALAMALVQYAGGSAQKDPVTEQWVPMSVEELKVFLAHLTRDVADLADKSDLWSPRWRNK